MFHGSHPEFGDKEYTHEMIKNSGHCSAVKDSPAVTSLAVQWLRIHFPMQECEFDLCLQH